MCLLLRKQHHWNFLKLAWQKKTCFCAQRLYSEDSNEIKVPFKMTGRFASNQQKTIISDFIAVSNSKNVDWNALKQSVLSLNRGYINEKNINGCILEKCTQKKRLDLAKSYMKYVRDCSQTKPILSLELLYLRSCYMSRYQLTDDDRNEIQTNCQMLLKNYSHLLNCFLLESIVMGLCCTDMWRDSLEHLKVVKNKNEISMTTMICIILKAFEEKEFDIGWTLIQDMYDQYEMLSNEVFVAWFNLCEKNINCSYLKVLEFLRDNECIVREDLAKLIHDKFNQFGNKSTTTMIYHHNGKCKHCNQILKPVEVTDSEFKKLQECFLSNVMIGKNIFNNSSPQEFNDFKDYIEMTAPYDVVVDGLNLAYAYRQKISNNSITKIIMKTFIENKMKVLLIGRKHLINMLGNEFDFIKRNAHIFFTNDVSKDDPFVLYAAMYSGFNTKILTRDLMRGHKFLLKNTEMKSVFQKWLQKHRLVLQLRKGDHVAVKAPITYLQTTQNNINGIWHLPYKESKDPGSWSKPDSTPDKWMCIKT